MRGLTATQPASAPSTSPRCRLGPHTALPCAHAQPQHVRFVNLASTYRPLVAWPDAATARSRVVLRAGRTSEPWWTRDNPANMKDVASVQELIDVLADAGDRLVIVEFYATWCNACRALFPKICKMIAEKPDVLFLKVNFDDNRDMCRTLGVKVLPFFHFYRGAEGRVDTFSATISKLPRFREALETYSSPFCSLEPAPGMPEFPGLIAHPELHPEEAAAAAAKAAMLATNTVDPVHPDELHPLADTPTKVG